MTDDKTGLIKTTDTRLPGFVEDAFESIDKMEQFANMLLKSKLVPNHFYEKLPDGKPDFTKGKTAAVVIVLLQGYQLDLPALTALQHVIPVNGLLSIKGDLAKSMIFRSGKLQKDSWIETVEGSIQDQNMIVTITAQRSDNGNKSTKSFSVAQAKRAGLWIDESKTQGSDGWKALASAWWKYPERMIYYRALGFIARDLFSDVLQGLYTTEEAADIPVDQTVSIDQGNGTTLQIANKDFAEDRSNKSTKRAVNKIADKTFDKIDGPEVKEVITLSHNGSGIAATNLDLRKDPENEEIPPENEPVNEGDLTIDQMTNMETQDLLNIINVKADMIDAMLMIPGKNTNKKLRDIIFAFQQGKLSQHVALYLTDENNPTSENDEANVSAEIAPNETFQDQGEANKTDLITPASSEMNDYNLDIPEFDKGQERDFKTVKDLYQATLTIKPRLDNEKFLDLIKDIPTLQKYKNKEDFLRYATIVEINTLLHENYLSL